MSKPSGNPVALITGGGGGIGRAAALAFAQAGYGVAIADIDADAAQASADLLKAAQFDAFALTVDIGDSTAVQAMLQQVRERYGRLDAAFNNAGASSLRTPLADVDEDDWERVMCTNVSGTFLCMKYQIRWMLEQGGGCIVNNCSVFGMGGGISATYTASKHAIAGLTRSAAISYAKQGVRINAVCPGLIDAGMGARFKERGAEDISAVLALHPAGRIGTAEEVAQAAVWLCSEHAQYIHGHLLPVDGGYSAR
ncbi:MAG: SDR family oxidoreductase [Pseudomonadota bacterium]|nr:SDR family oxidoreductase [Pseudomonadota bacterium]